MVITIRKGKKLSMTLRKGNQRILKTSLSPVCLLMLTHSAFSAGLDISGSLETSVMQQNRNSDLVDESLTTLSVEPEMIATYATRTFDTTLIGSVVHLERDSDDFGREDNYAKYRYSVNWRPVDNILSFEAFGNQTYINGTGTNSLVSDYFLNSESLTRVRTNRLNGNVNVPTNHFFQGGLGVSYTTTNSEYNQYLSVSGLNNDSVTGNALLKNPVGNRRHFWEVNANYMNLDRQGTDRNGFDLPDDNDNSNSYESTFVSTKLDNLITETWAFRLTASSDANNLTGRSDEFANDREFKSYGAGVTFRKAQDRYISVTANTIDSDIERDDGDVFLGLDMKWAITDRTVFSANYGHRFYGKSAGASLDYNTRHIRAKFRYTEEVTSYSQLIATPQELGVFVCSSGGGYDTGNFDLVSCFQPSSLNYQPKPGEQLVQFDTSNSMLDNNVILRKAYFGEIGFQGRRLTTAISAQYSDDRFLESQNTRTNYILRLDNSYALGRKTDLTNSFGYAKNEQSRMAALTEGESEQWNVSLGLRHDFGRALSAHTTLDYIERDGSLNAGVYGDNFSERRLSLSLTYKFD